MLRRLTFLFQFYGVVRTTSDSAVVTTSFYLLCSKYNEIVFFVPKHFTTQFFK